MRNRFISLSILSLVVLTSPAVLAAWNNVPLSLPVYPGRGTVQHGTFASLSAQAVVGYNIYLPPGYGSTPQRYPVIYHLHGLGGDENSEVFISSILDANIQNGTLQPMIMVFPNGYIDSFYSNSFNGSTPVESTIIQELLPYIDQNYQTKAGRNWRGIEGFSMGGQGAMLYACKYPQLFSSAIFYAGGYRTFDSLAQTYPATAAGVFNNSEVNYAPYSNWTWSNAHAGTIASSVKMKMLIGTADFLYPNTIDFVNNLAQLNIPFEFVALNSVGHDLYTYYTVAGIEGLRFHAASFQQTATPVFFGKLTTQVLAGTSVSFPLHASNNPTSFGASGLPPGLSLNAGTGVVSGRTTATGTWIVNARASNSYDTGYATLIFNVYDQAAVPGTPSISGPTLITAHIGVPINYQINGSQSPIAFSASSLPPGLTFDNVSGIISGAPTATGSFTIPIGLSNSLGSSSGTLTLIVSPNSAPVITAVAVAKPGSAVQGTATTLSVLASDDDGEPNLTYTWSASGPPPLPTFSINANNLARNSIAQFNAAGTYNLTATITDQGGLSATSRVKVDAVPFAITGVTVTAPADPNAVPAYSKFEMQVDINAVPVKSFDPNTTAGGLNLWASFTGPDNIPRTINGFNNGARWLIRFSPVAIGTWTYTVHASIAGGEATATGSFTSVAGPKSAGNTGKNSGGTVTSPALTAKE